MHTQISRATRVYSHFDKIKQTILISQLQYLSYNISASMVQVHYLIIIPASVQCFYSDLTETCITLKKLLFNEICIPNGYIKVS